ncbi:hypothetical protein GJ654_18920 [Rhodoblastus acidophilus]|uniref:Holin n=1 Tax=Rhodoblastus acidophilus TaxID=1074 RepID=A0A6N8DRL6_RHOAC|nr:hypothetical protein [Rhodoblastus acidophilus]MCW2276401.1 hypothetical protein [Rhodoblastus acidophilus]MTV33057.1 hypothetical protein [Rhodoblastus acidophilus]
MKRYLEAAALAVAIILFAWIPANAADAVTAVVIPWGDWLKEIIVSVGSLAVAVLSFVIAKWAPAYVKVFLTDDLIAKAVNYGLGAVEGAVAGKTLTLETTNEVLAAAEQFAVASAPRVSKWAGDNLRPLILSKLAASGIVPETVSADAVGAAVVTK